MSVEFFRFPWLLMTIPGETGHLAPRPPPGPRCRHNSYFFLGIPAPCAFSVQGLLFRLKTIFLGGWQQYGNREHVVWGWFLAEYGPLPRPTHTFRKHLGNSLQKTRFGAILGCRICGYARSASTKRAHSEPIQNFVVRRCRRRALLQTSVEVRWRSCARSASTKRAHGEPKQNFVVRRLAWLSCA